MAPRQRSASAFPAGLGFCGSGGGDDSLFRGLRALDADAGESDQSASDAPSDADSGDAGRSETERKPPAGASRAHHKDDATADPYFALAREMGCTGRQARLLLQIRQWT